VENCESVYKVLISVCKIRGLCVQQWYTRSRLGNNTGDLEKVTKLNYTKKTTLNECSKPREIEKITYRLHYFYYYEH
jgi:hypothetical protein